MKLLCIFKLFTNKTRQEAKQKNNLIETSKKKHHQHKKTNVEIRKSLVEMKKWNEDRRKYQTFPLQLFYKRQKRYDWVLCYDFLFLYFPSRMSDGIGRRRTVFALNRGWQINRYAILAFKSSYNWRLLTLPRDAATKIKTDTKVDF